MLKRSPAIARNGIRRLYRSTVHVDWTLRSPTNICDFIIILIISLINLLALWLVLLSFIAPTFFVLVIGDLSQYEVLLP